MAGTYTQAPERLSRAEAPERLSTPARISNLVVGLMRSYTGRGPTRSWTSIDEDLVTVVLRETLTKGERSLLADGYSQLVRETRKAYQLTMREDLIAGVQRITGRNVIAFLSDNHADPDIAIQSFVLEPEVEEEGPPAANGRR